MRVCVFGAGAVGGHLAVRLALSGHDVSVVVRGEVLAAIRDRGLTLFVGPERLVASVSASDDPADFGSQDFVISTLKSTALSSLARDVAPLLGAETPVIFAQNGIPWWYAHGAPPDAPVPDLGWLDPAGALADRIGIGRTIGGVIFSSNEVIEPGVVRNDSPDRNALVIGEPDGAASERSRRFRDALRAAGLESPEVGDLRPMLWNKLIANMTISVLCMVTGQSARAAVEDPLFTELVPRLMREAIGIAQAQGYAIQSPPAGSRAPDHKPSLLQDFLRRRPVEIDALVRAPWALARAAGLETPTLDVLGALADRIATDAGLCAERAVATF